MKEYQGPALLFLYSQLSIPLIFQGLLLLPLFPLWSLGKGHKLRVFDLRSYSPLSKI